MAASLHCRGDMFAAARTDAPAQPRVGGADRRGGPAGAFRTSLPAVRETTQGESVVDGAPEAGPLPGVVVVFSRQQPLYRPVPLLPGATHVLGREDVGGVAVPDERMSMQHAELRFEGGGLSVRDLDSRNGTFLDGQRVTGVVRARPGQVLRLAHTLLVVHADVRRFLAGHVATDGHVIGPAVRRVLDEAGVARRNGAHLLVRGESGAGKELVARHFHGAAERPGPFVAVNCATIAPELAPAAFFGSERGAFTHATKDRDGFLAEADGGVLFLDEIAELDLEVQAALLRAVETGEVMPLGTAVPRRVRVQVVAASHRNLREEVALGRFRQDLFFRLEQHDVALPPVRERLEEVPWLLQRALGDAALQLHSHFVEAALLRPWPGNVRELLSEGRRAASAALQAQSPVVRVQHLRDEAGRPLAHAHGVGHAASRRPSRDRGESDDGSAGASAPGGDGDANRGAPPAALTPGRKWSPLSKEGYEAALAQHGGNRAATARALGMQRTQLYRELQRVGLTAPGEPPAEPGPDDA